MGSRYGSLKQMEGIGPNNETILDYSVYDAVRSGFGKVVFVIRRCFSEEFKAIFSKERFGGRIGVDYVFQEMDSLPEGFVLPAGRTKPWGTNHAVMMGAPVVDTPFAAVNADDYYGVEAFEAMAGFLKQCAGKQNEYCMVGYKLKNTLSDYGSVSRGICTVDDGGNLLTITERSKIQRAGGEIRYRNSDGSSIAVDEETVVSMNMFGFTPDYFAYSEAYFKKFLLENIDNPTAEFYIPTMVNYLVGTGRCRMRVLSCNSEWFGMTYKEDRPSVMEKLNALIAKGVYPPNLWKK